MPTTTSHFGDEIPHPECVSLSCDECGETGYLMEHEARTADENDIEVLCPECGADA